MQNVLILQRSPLLATPRGTARNGMLGALTRRFLSLIKVNEESRWRTELLERAAAYESTQPSFAADLRATANAGVPAYKDAR